MLRRAEKTRSAPGAVVSRRVRRGLVADDLKTSRLAAGKSVEDVARLIGVAASSLRNWESGRNAPTVDLLLKFSQAVGVPMERLVRVPPDQRMLSDLRMLTGQTQPQLAKRLGVSTTVYAGIERGAGKLSEERAERLAAALSVGVREVRDAYERARNRPSGAPA